MKILFTKQSNRRGSALVVTLLISVIIGVVLGSYLMLIKTQNFSVARAQSWNAGIAVAEAGVEEALAHLNTGSSFFSLPPINTDGWTTAGTRVVAPRRFLGSNYYDASIVVATNPIIYVTGYTRVPISGKILARTLRVKTAPMPLITSAMVAMTNIALSGTGIETDSYDSTDPNKSTNGDYDPAKAQAKGDLVTNSNSTDKNRPAIGLGNGKIKGRVRTGPTGLVTMNSASVGDVAWVNSGTLGIKPGYYLNDMNVTLPDVQVPYTSALPLPPKSILNSLPDYILPAGDYYVNGSINLSGTSKTNFLIAGNVRLYVSGSFTVNGMIAIQPGSSLTLFVGSKDTAHPTATTLGTMYVDRAQNFQYFGLPNNTSIVYGGGNDFRAVLFAPQAALKLGGGGSTDYDFRGTYMINSVELNGHFKFHFDESLPKMSLFRGYIATSWEEL
jgi:hypothetical protein